MKTIVADITSAKAGSESRLLETLSVAFPADGDRTYIVCLTHQQPIIDTRFAGRIRSLQATAHFTSIAALIQREFVDSFAAQSVSNDTSLTVVSFHSAVLGLSSYVPPSLKARVEFIRWTRLFNSSLSSGLPSSKETITQSLQNLMPEEEILGAVTRMLSESRAVDPSSSILMSDMRPLLEQQDLRFKKSNPAASVSGLIGAVIELAERRGLVEVDRRSNRFNSPVWLAQGALVSRPTSAAEDVTVDGTRKGASKPHAPGAKLNLEIQSSSDNSSPDATSSTSKDKTRSDHFVSNLRAQSLGPFSRIRIEVYNALDALINKHDTPKTASSLIRESVEVVRQRIALDKEGAGEYPWRLVREFLRELLSRCPVLVDTSGAPVKSSFQTLSTQVVGLVPNWRLILDGELMLALIRGGIRLHMGDIGFLAGALYNVRSSESEMRVEELISYLIEQSRVTEDADHFLIEPPSNA